MIRTAVFEQVLRPGRIGGLVLPNRVIMGSMHLGTESAADARVLAAFYAERARGGAALIVTGGSAVSRVGAGGRNYSFINEADDAARLAAVVQAVHAAGGLIALQLFHAGRYASENYFGLTPLAPSAVPSRFSKSTPRAMTAADIEATIADFAAGARRARELGFDAVEVMGSEGYLLNQFVSPLTNQRSDAWGGDFERRTRFPLAVLAAIRTAAGADFPLLYRISGTDLMPGSSSDEETAQFARLLAAGGADALDMGIGWHESSTPTVQAAVVPGAWIGVAQRIKHAAGTVPVIASTRISTLELAEQVLAEHGLDFVAMARPFLADAFLVAKARRGAAVNHCIACNQACIDRSLRDQVVSCMVNPRAGEESRWQEMPLPVRRCFAVIGGGPAGLEAARVFAVLGQRVVLYEAATALGGQFRLASHVPDKEIYGDTIHYFEQELRRLGVELRLGCRIDAGSQAELAQYDGVVVASGVVPRSIKLPGAQLPHVQSYAQALAPEATPAGRAAQPAAVAIIGAGGIGVDVAHLYSHAGWPVTLMCRGATIGAHIGRSTRWVAIGSLRRQGVQLLTQVSYECIDQQGVWIHHAGVRRLIEARRVIIAAGQESQALPREWLERSGVPWRVVGGAHVAAELDAVRAFREGALAARELVRDAAARA